MRQEERELLIATTLELVCDHLATFFGENIAEGDWFQARDADNEGRFTDLAKVCSDLRAVARDSRSGVGSPPVKSYGLDWRRAGMV